MTVPGRETGQVPSTRAARQQANLHPRLNHQLDLNCSIQKTIKRSRSRGDVILRAGKNGSAPRRAESVALLTEA